MLDAWLGSLMGWARRHARLVVIGAVALAASSALLVSRVTFDANILRLLPKQAPAVESFNEFLEAFGSLDHLYVVFESPDGIDAHKALVDAYVSALRETPEIASVDSQLFEPGRDWSYLGDRVLFLLGPFGAADALQRLSPPRLDAELAHARDRLSVPSPGVTAYVQRDPVGLLDLLRTRLERDRAGLSIDPAREGYVSADGSSRLVMVKPRGAPFDTAFCRQLFARLTAIEQTARGAAPESAGVHIQTAGAYRISLEAEQLIRREGILNAVVSLALLLLVVLVVFRTPWMLVFGTMPLALAALLSLGINGWLRGGLSPATSGSAGMLFGLGIDGVVLLYVRYLEERQSGRTGDEATRGMAGTASSVVLAQVTTVATFLALLVLDFPSLNDLGALVGVGMLIVCPLTLVLLPALLTRMEGGRFRRPPSAPWLGRFVVARARAILVAGAVATLLLGAAAWQLRIDTRLERLQAHTAAADLERAIADRFGLPQNVLLAINAREHLEPLVEADRRLAEQVSRLDPTIGASGIGSLLPPARVQAQVAGVLLGSARRPDQVKRDVEAAGARAGFKPRSFAPFFDRLPVLLNPDARITYPGLVEHGLGPLVSRFLAEQQGGFVSVTYLYPRRAVNLESLEAAVRRADSGFRLTGLTLVNRELASRFLPEFSKGLVIGTLAVALLIFAVVRRVSLTLLALLPTLVGFIWSAGLLALLHLNLDLFSLFATVTFVGMAVDYGVYVLYRHRVEGLPVGDVLSQTGAAVAVACLTALIGFGTLVASSYAPLRLFGIMSIITLTCCLAAALLVLPALLLHLPAGVGGERKASEPARNHPTAHSPRGGDPAERGAGVPASERVGEAAPFGGAQGAVSGVEPAAAKPPGS